MELSNLWNYRTNGSESRIFNGFVIIPVPKLTAVVCVLSCLILMNFAEQRKCYPGRVCSCLARVEWLVRQERETPSFRTVQLEKQPRTTNCCPRCVLCVTDISIEKYCRVLYCTGKPYWAASGGLILMNFAEQRECYSGRVCSGWERVRQVHTHATRNHSWTLTLKALNTWVVARAFCLWKWLNEDSVWSRSTCSQLPT